LIYSIDVREFNFTKKYVFSVRKRVHNYKHRKLGVNNMRSTL